MNAPVFEVRTKARPPVLAILPHYGHTAITEASAGALRQAGYPELHLVVVDNSGNLERGRLPEDVELVVPGRNIGYCAAVNAGIDRAVEGGHPFVLFINNDTEIGPGIIEGLVDALLADESTAGVGPLLTTSGGSKVWSAGSYLRFGPNEVCQRGLGLPVESAPRFPTEVDFIPGALALYRTSDLVGVGGLAEDYFMYLEDVDLGIRLRKRGRRLLYLPWVHAHHGGSVSSGGGVTALRKFLNGVNTPRLLRLCRSPRLWVSFVLFDILGFLPSLLLHVTDRKRFAAQVAKGRGILMGLRGYTAGPGDVDHYCPVDEKPA